MTTLVTFLTDRLAQDPTVAGSKGSTLRGKTASRGRATGTARVLRADAAPPRLHEGDILVTTNVGPDWTPFLPLLAGIVLDSDEIFQHPTLVAREYRIPAVFQTRVGTSRIREGQVITVDGDAGIVELGIEGEGKGLRLPTRSGSPDRHCPCR